MKSSCQSDTTVPSPISHHRPSLRRPPFSPAKRMTTYGTIPNPPSSSSSDLQFSSRANQRHRFGLSKHRPWSEMLSLHSLSLPSSFGESLFRLSINTSYFQNNYAIAVLFLFFLSLLWHPVSLIVFVVMMAGWLFFYFLRDEPVTFLGRSIDDRLILAALAALTLVFLFLTDAKVNIVVAVIVGMVLVVAHAVVRRTDDLTVDEFDEESVSAGIRAGYDVVPLKDLASSFPQRT